MGKSRIGNGPTVEKEKSTGEKGKAKGSTAGGLLVKIGALFCKIGFHRHFPYYDTGKTVYLRCVRINCNARDVYQYGGGHQPIGWDWVNGRTDELFPLNNRPLPNVRSSVSLAKDFYNEQ